MVLCVLTCRLCQLCGIIRSRFLQLEWENSRAAAAKDNCTADAAVSNGDSALSSSSVAPDSSSSYNVEKAVFVNVKAPRQHNSFDCGVYILKFADVILENYAMQDALFDDSGPISKDIIDDKLVQLIQAKAVSPDDITIKRTEIQDFVTADTDKYHESVRTLAAEQKQKKSETVSADDAGSATQVDDSQPMVDSTGETEAASN